MLQPLLELYKTFDTNKSMFTSKGLSGTFFMDVLRTQPQEPERYEYFSLPAIFVDYTMRGQGKGKPRLVTISLHIITDEMADGSNVSPNKTSGLNKLLYNLLIQEILEGARLGETTPLKFIDENSIDDAVTNYHSQSYEFESYLSSMIANSDAVFAAFDELNIYGTLKQKL